MKFNSRKEAVRMAENERRKFQLSTSWKMETWENIGWHYCFKRGHVTIYVSTYVADNDGPCYHAMISDKDGGIGTPSMWASRGTNIIRSPLDAVRLAYSKFEKAAQEVEAAIMLVRESFDVEGMRHLTREKLGTNV